VSVHRPISVVVVACLIALSTRCAGSGSADPESASGRRPDLVLVTVDGLDPSELSVYGGRLAVPTLERLSEQGTAFEDAWTASPLTRPAVATYLTGLAPDRHGVRDDRVSSLPAGVPTLAGALGAVGYRTAAFPDSSFLGPSSGVLREFEIVDDPPRPSIGPILGVPDVRPVFPLADNFDAWVETVPADEPLFAWIHLSSPMMAQFQDRYAQPGTEDGESAAPAQLPAFDRAVGRVDEILSRVVGSLETRDRLSRSAIVVAGTMGRVWRPGPSSDGEPAADDLDLSGPGFSVGEPALRVPLVVRFPAGAPRPAAAPAWATDVAPTLAALAGVDMAGAEGVDLANGAAPDRVRLAWAWATRDQMGWRGQRVARAGRVRHNDGLADPTASLSGEPVDPGIAADLAQALAARNETALPSVDYRQISSILEQRGLVLDPVSDGGREFGDPATRHRVVEGVWNARWRAQSEGMEAGADAYRGVLRIDPDNLAALVGLGQLLALNGSPEAVAVMTHAVERYPSQPGVLHWYAHATWSQSWQDAEKLLHAILPLEPMDADLLYDLACTRSLAGDVTASAARLREAIEAGYRAWPHIETDPDLRTLRENRRFAEVMKEYGR